MADVETTEQVQIRFTVFETNEDNTITSFTDALYYPVDDVPNQKTIDQEIQLRYDNYLAVIQAAEDAPDPEPEEQFANINDGIDTVLADIAALQNYHDDLISQKADIEDDIDPTKIEPDKETPEDQLTKILQYIDSAQNQLDQLIEQKIDLEEQIKNPKGDGDLIDIIEVP